VELLEEGHRTNQAADGGPVQTVAVQHQLPQLEAEPLGRILRQRAAEEVIGDVEKLEVGKGLDEKADLGPLAKKVVGEVELRDVGQAAQADSVTTLKEKNYINMISQ
jgi:hypothetical protein